MKKTRRVNVSIPVTVYIAEQLSPVDEECGCCREVIPAGDRFVWLGTDPDRRAADDSSLCRFCSAAMPATQAKPL